MFQNDVPIKTKDEDLLNRASFSEKFGQSLLEWDCENCLVTALYGNWGSGKSSIINLVIEYIEKKYQSGKKDKSPIILTFNPWNFTEQNQLVSIFLRELGKAINYYDSSEDAKRVGQELIVYSKLFLPLALIPPVTPVALIMNKILETIGEVTKLWGEQKTKSVEQLKDDLDENIKKLGRKIILVIDDIDRLNKTEIRQIFQLVKLNANFPNIIYILPFDQEKVSDVLTEESFPGRDYLEKIVQVSFQVPAIEQVKLDAIFLNEVNILIKPLPQKYWNEKYFGDIYYGSLRRYFSSVRQIKRFANSLHFNNRHLHNELNPVDLIALEAVRVFSPELYDEMWKNKELFIDSDSGFRSNSKENDIRRGKLDEVFNKANLKYREITKKVIFNLFPQLMGVYGNNSYGSDWQDRWYKERRIASSDRFDKYFQFTLPEEEISQDEIDGIVKESYNTVATEKHLIALIKRRKIKSFLEKLSLYLDETPEENVGSFVLALFNISDKLSREKGDFGLLDTSSWCIRFGYHMLLKIKDLEKRKNVFLGLIKKSRSLSIPAKLVSIEVRERKGDANKSEPLVQTHDLDLFRKTILDKIEEFASTDKLLEVPSMIYTLYLWRDLSSIDEPKKFVTNLIATDRGLVKLIENAMHQLSSQMIGDCFATTTWQIDLKSLEAFTDLHMLKERVSSLPKDVLAQLSEQQQLGVKLFKESAKLDTKSLPSAPSSNPPKN